MSDTSDTRRRVSAKDELRHREHIAERDSMRRLPGFSVDRARRLEQKEIGTNWKGFERRHRGEGLDPVVKAELQASKNSMRRRRAKG